MSVYSCSLGWLETPSKQWAVPVAVSQDDSAGNQVHLYSAGMTSQNWCPFVSQDCHFHSGCWESRQGWHEKGITLHSSVPGILQRTELPCSETSHHPFIPLLLGSICPEAQKSKWCSFFSFSFLFSIKNYLKWNEKTSTSSFCRKLMIPNLKPEESSYSPSLRRPWLLGSSRNNPSPGFGSPSPKRTQRCYFQSIHKLATHTGAPLSPLIENSRQRFCTELILNLKSSVLWKGNLSKAFGITV